MTLPTADQIRGWLGDGWSIRNPGWGRWEDPPFSFFDDEHRPMCYLLGPNKQKVTVRAPEGGIDADRWARWFYAIRRDSRGNRKHSELYCDRVTFHPADPAPEVVTLGELKVGEWFEFADRYVAPYLSGPREIVSKDSTYVGNNPSPYNEPVHSLHCCKVRRVSAPKDLAGGSKKLVGNPPAHPAGASDQLPAATNVVAKPQYQPPVAKPAAVRKCSACGVPESKYHHLHSEYSLCGDCFAMTRADENHLPQSPPQPEPEGARNSWEAWATAGWEEL